ncbi:hypothetical protein Tco_1532320 [Tanacetum coccineum]
MDDPNITMEEYIRLEEEKARRRGKVYNWETATYGKIWDNEDVHDLGSVETEFPAIVFNDTLTSEATLSCEPTVSSLNNEIEFRISFDESDDEDYTIADTAYPNPMDTAYRLSGRYPIFIFSTVYMVYLLNEYSVFDTGPRERKIDNIGDVFTNLEILKCWSLENFKAVVQHEILLINATWRIYLANIRGVSHSNSF